MLLSLYSDGVIVNLGKGHYQSLPTQNMHTRPHSSLQRDVSIFGQEQTEDWSV